jgi:hypothetical protein
MKKPSFIAKILGVFTVRSNQLNEIHLMLMENTLRTESLSKLNIFDLKGSYVDRKSSQGSSVMKDTNYREWVRHK